MRNIDEDNITQAVVARHAAAVEARSHELVRYMISAPGLAPNGQPRVAAFTTLDFAFVLNAITGAKP